MQGASSPDIFWHGVLGVLGFVSVGGLIGYLRFRLELEKAPHDKALVIAQTEVQRATAAQIVSTTEKEAREELVASLHAGIRELREDVLRLRQERDEALRMKSEALRHAGSAEVAKEEAEQKLKFYEEQRQKVKGVLDAHGLEYPS